MSACTVAGVRPVPLEIHIHGFEISNFESRMQAMSRPCYSNIVMYAGEDKPAIVFVPTRKHARLTTLDLLMYAAADGRPSQFLQVSHFLNNEANFFSLRCITCNITRSCATLLAAHD